MGNNVFGGESVNQDQKLNTWIQISYLFIDYMMIHTLIQLKSQTYVMFNAPHDVNNNKLYIISELG